MWTNVQDDYTTLLRPRQGVSASNSPQHEDCLAGAYSDAYRTQDTFSIRLPGKRPQQLVKGTWRTDVMVLTVIDRQTYGVGVLAIPRVLQVSIPGHPPEWRNTVAFLVQYVRYPGDGQALRDDTLRRSLDLGLDRCIRVYFTGFVALLDIRGGIDVMIDCAFEEVSPAPELPAGRLLRVSPGPQPTARRTALLNVHVRHRTIDTDRSRRRRKVLMAILDEALQLDVILLLPQLWANYHTTIQTDLSLIEALELAPGAARPSPKTCTAG